MPSVLFTIVLLLSISHNAIGFSAGLDTHIHIVSEKNMKAVAGGVQYTGPVFKSAEDVVEELDSAKMEQGFILSFAYRLSKEVDARYENDFVAAEANKFPGRLQGFCSVRIGTDWAVKETERCFSELKLFGLKLHLQTNGIDVTFKDKMLLVHEVLQVANKYEVPALIHFDFVNPMAVMNIFNLIYSNPNVSFIISHSFGYQYRELDMLIELIERWWPEDRRKNVYLETSGVALFYSESVTDVSALSWRLKRFGIERVLFGSDAPFDDMSKAKEALGRLNLSPQELNMVLSMNGETLVHRRLKGVSE